MSEGYSWPMTLVFIFSFYAFSLIVSLIYLCRRLDRKKTSCIIFILSIIYVSLFIYLNIVAIFDLFFNNNTNLVKFFKFIRKFYLGFTIVDKALGFVLFSILIYYLESGYYSKRKKLSDGIIRTFYAFKKLTKCQIIIILSIAVPLVSVLLALLIIYRDHYDLGKNPIDYIGILLDCYAVFEIYSGVGFFLVQLIKDCKRPRSEQLIKRYYRYSITKIINKTEKYINNINNTYQVLNKNAPIFENNNSYPFHAYLQEQFKKVSETINSLGGISVYINNNNNNNNNYSETNIIKNTFDEINLMKQNNNNNLEVKKKEQMQTAENNNKGKVIEEDYSTCTSIRKYKKAVRRIDKLKQLYRDIEQISNIPANKKCSCQLVLLFIAFSISIVTDFVLPLAFDFESDYYGKDDIIDGDEGKTLLGVAPAILAIILSSTICCSYTIITLFSTTRRRYITGDFLYNKQINDDLSLMKTVQVVCGYSFTIVYCNLYFWKAADKKGALGRPVFYEEIIIPDYVLIQGVSVYMIIKIIIIIASIIASYNLKFSEVFVFKNDLAEYNSSKDGCQYDNYNTFNIFLQEKQKINNILKS